MIDTALTELVEGGWLLAVLRLAFVGLIYLFLFLVLRATVSEMAAVARGMAYREGTTAEARLVLEDGADSSLVAGESWLLRPMTAIGRTAKNDIVIDDPHVSAHHAELRFERGHWWLRDLGSKNGTWLNDEPVRAVVAMRHGDVLQCGRVRFSLATSFAVPVERPSA